MMTYKQEIFLAGMLCGSLLNCLILIIAVLI